MNLYYSPGACSMAPHIVMNESGLDFDIIKVDFASKTTETGVDFMQVNQHGLVPVIELDNGEVLSEGVAIMQYIADQAPDANLAPANGSLARSRLHERLNFLTTELHKAFSPLFSSDSTEAEKAKAVAKVSRSMDFLDGLLTDQDYLLGDSYSVADAYLFVISNWTTPTGIGLDKWPNIQAFSQRIAARPAVQATMQAEGLLN